MPQETFHNEFFKGLNTDVDLTKLENAYMRKALNVRLIELEGKGLVATNVNGNSHILGENGFVLTEGFEPIGQCQFNGIAYIISINRHLPFIGPDGVSIKYPGEIGCFPTPNCISTGFSPFYSPLQNFSGPVPPPLTPSGPIGNFSSNGFNFSGKRQVAMFARDNFDGTVNIYFTDFENPLRVINSNFNQDGLCQGTYYSDESFPNFINASNETCYHPTVSRQPGKDYITSNGNLKCGNYFFFFRYNKNNFTPSSFVSEIGPFQISPDDPVQSGITTDGGPGTLSAGKCVNLRLTDLDPAYDYIEVAFAHYTDAGVEYGLVDKFYQITRTGAVVNPLDISVCGNESVVDFTAEQIFARKPTDDVCKDITQYEDRLWEANTKEFISTFHPDMITFANIFSAKYDDTTQIVDTYFAPGQDANTYGQYKDYNKTLENVGYFRGETYAFGMVFVLNNGRETDAFPISGSDDWDLIEEDTNTDGIYRFPNLFNSEFKVAGPNGNLKLMGVRFRNSLVAKTFFNSSDYLKNNVCGYYIVRANRKPNLVYQGVGLQCYNIDDEAHGDLNDLMLPVGRISCAGDDVTCRLNSSNFIPLVDGTCLIRNTYSGDSCPLHDILNVKALVPVTDKYGIFSPDHFFNKSFQDKDYKIYKFGDIAYVKTDSHIIPYYYNTHEVSSITFVNQSVVCKLRNMQDWTVANNNLFVSMFNQGTCTDGLVYAEQKSGGFFGGDTESIFNLAFSTPRYIAADEVAVTGTKINLDNKLINIYNDDPERVNGFSILNAYQPRSLSYSKISPKLDPLTDISGIIFFKGDCFLQRMYIKQECNPNIYSIDEETEEACQFPPPFPPVCSPTRTDSGIMMSIVTESAYNTAMRYESQGQKYYPETGISNSFDFIIGYTGRESDFFNIGYNKVISDVITYHGYDSTQPNSKEKRYPTRVRYSLKHVMGELTDSYRQLLPGNFKDYDLRIGEINKIVDMTGKMLIVQDQGVSILYVNERSVLNSATSGSFVIGQGDVLAEKALCITDNIGSQHQWSILKASNKVYGIDFNKRKIWSASPEGKVEYLSDTKFVREFINEVANQFSLKTDIEYQFPDSPVLSQGISCIYDKKYNEILWTFIFEDPSKNRTIGYSDLFSKFGSEYSFNSPFYVAINNDLFSAERLDNKKFYLHDIGIVGASNNKSVFYDVTNDWFLTYIVNPNPEIAKVFDNKFLTASGEPFTDIIYDTENQHAEMNPFINPGSLWLNPSYRENEWRFPVQRETFVIPGINNIYSIDSRLRGKFLITKLHYFGNNPIFVKSSTTLFRVSKS